MNRSNQKIIEVACTGCHREYPLGTLGRCSNCGSIMRVQYPDETIQSLRDVQPGPGIDRYRNLFPVSTKLPYLGEGNTPLIKSRRIGPSIGMENLYFKYEGTNPSGAFKDRSGALVAALAMDADAGGILTPHPGMRRQPFPPIVPLPA